MDFMENSAFFQDDSPEALQVFKEDVNALIANTKTFIIFGAKASKGHTYELLNGGKTGDKALLKDGSSYHPVETLAKFVDGINNKLSVDGLSMGIHEDYGISGEHHLLYFISKKMSGNVLQINVSANLLKEEKELYYKSIFVLSETIKDNL
jgi:hypothetical protein